MSFLKKPKPRALIADDHPAVRRGVREILAEEFPNLRLEEAANHREVSQKLQEGPLDLVLLDIKMPGRNGLDILEDIVKIAPATPTCIFSAYGEKELAVRAIQLGAKGYLLKDCSAEELVAAVQTILSGHRYIPPHLGELLAEYLLPDRGSACPHEKLTPRELSVFMSIVQGKSTKQIAEELDLSQKTIATYRARIVEKTRLRTPVAMTRYAFEHGLTRSGGAGFSNNPSPAM